MKIKRFKYVLYPLSLLYGAAVYARNLLYDLRIIRAEKLNVPVLSVGNITAGGTGKTPAVLFLANILSEKRKKVGIVSRGYKRKTRGYLLVSDGQRIIADADSGGDEPVMMAKKNPDAVIAVDENRVKAGRRIIKEHKVDIIIMDDGFQHRKLSRDFDLVLINAGRTEHLRNLLPAGRLRESMSSLKRADCIIATKLGDDSQFQILENIVHRYVSKPLLKAETKSLKIIEGIGGGIVPETKIKFKTAFLFAGIAEPREFRKSAIDMGIRVGGSEWFQDHKKYSKSDIRLILRKADKYGADFVLTTEKDIVRLEKYKDLYNGNIPFYVLTADFSLEADGRKYIERFINQLFNK